MKPSAFKRSDGELGKLPKLATLQVVFVGQPEFEDQLNSQGLRQLRQRIEIRHQISLLSNRESEDYIDHRLDWSEVAVPRNLPQKPFR